MACVMGTWLPPGGGSARRWWTAGAALWRVRRGGADGVVGAGEEIAGRAPGEAALGPEVVGVDPHQVDLRRAREVRGDRVRRSVRDAPRVGAPEELDALPRRSAHDLANVLPG